MVYIGQNCIKLFKRLLIKTNSIITEGLTNLLMANFTPPRSAASLRRG